MYVESTGNKHLKTSKLQDNLIHNPVRFYSSTPFRTIYTEMDVTKFTESWTNPLLILLSSNIDPQDDEQLGLSCHGRTRRHLEATVK